MHSVEMTSTHYDNSEGKDYFGRNNSFLSNIPRQNAFPFLSSWSLVIHNLALALLLLSSGGVGVSVLHSVFTKGYYYGH
jgi:hypothetical protein